MNNEGVTIGFRFILLAMAQVLIFNHIDLFGYINPYIYILFVIMYPIRKEGRVAFLVTSFLLGLTIDLFSDSGGVNAAAMVSIAYLRPVFLKFAFGNNYEFQSIRIGNTPPGQRLVYIMLLVVTHHLILFSLEIFSFSHILSILKKTLVCGVFTLFLSLLAIPLFRKKKT